MRISDITTNYEKLIGSEITIEGFLVARRGQGAVWYVAPSKAQVGDLAASVQIDLSKSEITLKEDLAAWREHRWNLLDLAFQLSTVSFCFTSQIHRRSLVAQHRLVEEHYDHYTDVSLTGRLVPATSSDFQLMLTDLTLAVFYNGDETLYVKLGGATFDDVIFRVPHRVYKIEDLLTQQELPFGEIIAIDGFLVSDNYGMTSQRIIPRADFRIDADYGNQGIRIGRDFAAMLWNSRLLPLEIGGNIHLHSDVRIIGTLRQISEFGCIATLRNIKEFAFEFGDRVTHWQVPYPVVPQPYS